MAVKWFTHSFNKHLLNTYIPGAVVGSCIQLWTKQIKSLCSQSFHSGEVDGQQTRKYMEVRGELKRRGQERQRQWSRQCYLRQGAQEGHLRGGIWAETWRKCGTGSRDEWTAVKVLRLVHVWHGLLEEQQGASVAGRDLCHYIPRNSWKPPAEVGPLKLTGGGTTGVLYTAGCCKQQEHAENTLEQEERPLSAPVFLQSLHWQNWHLNILQIFFPKLPFFCWLCIDPSLSSQS